MEKKIIMGLPALNFQALLGLVLFAATFFLVKLIRGVQTGRYPGGGAMLLYLRSVLWLCLVGGLMMFFGALLGFRYV